MTTPTPTTLYRLYDAEGALLYVGITSRGLGRWTEHSKVQPWWPEVDHVTTEHFATRRDAMDAERTAIVEEHPLHNVQHNARLAPKVVGRRIEVRCSECGQVIDGGDGYLEVSNREVHEVEEAWERHREDQRSKQTPGTLQFVDISALMALPAKVEWVAWHRACDPDPHGSTYWIDVDRIASIEDVLRWNEHLLEKEWVHQYTDWTRMLGELVSPDARRLRLVDS